VPIYDYFCEKCDHDFEIIKSIKEYDGKDQCPECGNIGQRILSCSIYFTGTKIEDAEFNVGLGKITKSKKHREELAKRAGAIEIGNENPDKIHDHFDKQREEKRARSWEDV
jgi:putative FmdB family regulatory protein